MIYQALGVGREEGVVELDAHVSSADCGEEYLSPVAAALCIDSYLVGREQAGLLPEQMQFRDFGCQDRIVLRRNTEVGKRGRIPVLLYRSFEKSVDFFHSLSAFRQRYIKERPGGGLQGLPRGEGTGIFGERHLIVADWN